MSPDFSPSLFAVLMAVWSVVCVFCRSTPGPVEQKSNFTAKSTLHTATTLAKTAPPTTLARKSPSGEFSDFLECSTPTGATILDVPDIGLDFEMELQGTDSNSNLTYKTATFADGLLQRGVVAMDFADKKEIILYDILSSTIFHVRDHTCTAEPLSRTMCNPLSYFIFGSAANHSDAVAACKFERSKPVFLGLRPAIHGDMNIHGWQHCLRLQTTDKTRHIFQMKFYFRTNIFASPGVGKYIPMRISVDRLYPIASASAKLAKQNNIVFDFISFRPRLKNRSIFQAKEYANCTGWKKA